MDYKSKKVAIISVLSTLLVVGAIAGTVAFIKGNNQSGAAENVIANEVANNIIVENVIDGDTNTNTNTNTNSVVPSNNGNAGGDGGNIAPVAPDNTPTTDENGNEVIIDVDGNSHVIGPVTNDDGSTTTTEGDGIGGYIQRTVIPEHMVWEWTIVDWTEILPKTIAANIEIPSLEGEKYYEVDGQESDTAVVVGQNITYYIDVTNTGDTKLEQFRVVDSVPQGTELVKGTISDEGNLDEYGRVIWKLDLNPQETKTVSFKVTVTSNEVKSIVNQAKVNGEGTNETKTPVIEANKKAFVVEEDGTLSERDAKVDETIRYVISLTNKSDVEGTTTVKDTVPENTRFVSADERFTVSEDESSLEATISVPAGETIELTFDVEVYDDEEDEETTTSVRNIAIIGGVPTPPVDTKVANITTEKIATPDEPLHELGKIHYELVSTNNGEGKGTVTITDTVPAGTELVPNSITNGGTMGEDGVITWNVTLEAGKSATSAFDVIVLPFSNEEGKLTVRNATAKQDGEEIPPTETVVEKEYVTVKVNKEFVDVTNNVDNTRPTTITVELSNNATDETKTQELNADNNWEYTFEKLDKYHTDKTEIEYDVKEIDVNSYYADTYETSKDGDNYSIKVINTLKYEEIKTEKVATKVWVDNDNTSGNRPTSVVLDLYADGDFLKSSDPIEGNKTTNEGWTYTFTELQKYHEDGTEIEYTIEENDNSKDPHYTVNEEGLTVTNTIDYNTFKTTVSATKNWVDNSNKTNHRPQSIHLNVLNDKDEVVLENEEVTGTGDSWTYTSEEVPMYYDDGTTIVYSVKEVEEDQTPYETEYSDDTLTITNTIDYNNYKTNVSATKVWVDNNNNSGNRPTSIHLNVLNDKDEVVLENEEVTGNATDGSWTYTSEEVPMYYDDGTTIVYSVVEVEANTGNYNTTYSQDKLTVTNTIDYDNYTVDVPVKKTWSDDDDREEVRPDSVSFDLYVRKEAGDEKVSSHSVEKDTWTYTFTGLAKYDDAGNELSYYAREAVAPTHYTMEQVSDTEIKNKIDYTSFTIDKPVTKVWVDEPNTTHSDITFELWGNNDDTKPAGTHTLKDGETTYTFRGLQKYNADGSTITYIVKEVEEGQNNYTTTYDQNALTVTNTIVDPTTKITITKIWVDPDEEGTTHKDIDVRILQNGTTYKVVTIPGQADNTYTYTESNLPKYKKNASGYILDANGNVQNNVYTVEEITTGWTDYTPSYSTDTLTITNTIVEDNKASLSLIKNWVDDKTEHPTIKIWLTKKNSDSDTYSKTDKFVELPSGTTTYTFTGLQKYDENGQYIKYGVEEETVKGYTTTYNGNTITNTIEAGETSVTVEKTWIRPDENYEAVTIRLYQGDTEYDHVTFTKDDYTNGKATYTFSPLPEYNTTTGQKYVYTTREDTVEGYSTNVVGTNKYQNVIEPGSKDVTVTKTWDAPAGNIPNITIILRDGTTEVGRYELVYPETSHTFEGLPKYNTTTGQEITYTVDEVSIDGYDTTINGTNITNKVIEPNDASITITKNWIDPSDMTHPDVKFILKQNGVQYPDANTYYTMPGEGTKDTTTLPITGLPRYKKNGNEYVKGTDGRVVENVYTVEEVVPTGYELIEQSTDTFTVTNRILQDNTKVVDVTKEWSIPEGVTVTKPTITVNLLRDGTEVDEKQIVPPSTTCSFPNLPVYDLDPNSSRYGERYVYTVTEDEVRNFVSTVNGYTITNTFDQEIKGTVTFEQTIHGEADVKVPMDVVFVLDVSGSMTNQMVDQMVKAVNDTINTIMNRNTGNIENRFAIVTYSGSSKVLVPLGTYMSSDNNKYLRTPDNTPYGNYYIYTDLYDATVVTAPNGNKYLQKGNKHSVETSYVTGGTYTQAGIAAGANELINSENKTITETIDGFEYTYARTPVMILLTDGAPTYYTDSTTVTSSSQRHSNDDNVAYENEVYWTIRTAKAYKDRITAAYYTNNNIEGTAKFATVGYGISSTVGQKQTEKVVLNPTKANIELLPQYDSNWWWSGSDWEENRYQEIYNKLKAEDSTLNTYTYSDLFSTVDVNTSELTNFFNQALSQDKVITPSRDITLAESDAMRVYMPDIDPAKAFSIKINGTTVTTSLSHELVKRDGTLYYVDLSTLDKGTRIDIFYTKVTQTAGE